MAKDCLPKRATGEWRKDLLDSAAALLSGSFWRNGDLGYPSLGASRPGDLTWFLIHLEPFKKATHLWEEKLLFRLPLAPFCVP